MLRHIVMFQLKDKKDTELLKNKLLDLKNKIDFIINLEVGVNFIESERAMDLVITLDLEDKEALEAYRIHPEHLPVVQLIKEICSQTKAVDYIV